MNPDGSIDVDLPGLSRGNILAMRLDNGYWAIMSVERATVLNGDTTYYGQSLFFVIGDQVQSFVNMTQNIVRYGQVKQVTATWGQLKNPPLPPYYKQVRLQPMPSDQDTPILEVPGMLLIDSGFSQQYRYWLKFRGDWSPLFKRP